jgi:CYTH domain-containing protein
MPEIERKFLVGDLPVEVRDAGADDLRQGYLTTEPVEVRIRSRAGHVHELTVKSAGGLSRAEVNVPLTREQFDELWPLVERSIEKERTVLTVGDLSVEVDVYRGKLAGLVVAEVEFPTEAAARAFTPPAWFGAEVTTDRRFRNAALAAAAAPPQITLPA